MNEGAIGLPWFGCVGSRLGSIPKPFCVPSQQWEAPSTINPQKRGVQGGMSNAIWDIFRFDPHAK